MQNCRYFLCSGGALFGKTPTEEIQRIDKHYSQRLEYEGGIGHIFEHGLAAE